MKTKSKRYDGYFEFMEQFFEKGNQEDIVKAKKEYRKQYKAKWRRENRRVKKEVVTTWERHEFTSLKSEAKRHKLPIAPFIKQAVTGYINTRYVPLHQKEVAEILQRVTMTSNTIENLTDDGVLPKEVSLKVTKAIAELEHQIRIALFSPKTIWQILSNALGETPTLKPELITYIQNFAP